MPHKQIKKLEDLPENIRKLIDKNNDGKPDFFDQIEKMPFKGLIKMFLSGMQSYGLSSKHYKSIEDLPENIRKMIDMNNNGKPDVLEAFEKHLTTTQKPDSASRVQQQKIRALNAKKKSTLSSTVQQQKIKALNVKNKNPLEENSGTLLRVFLIIIVVGALILFLKFR
jgi:cation transport regulator ChaB